MSRRRPIQLRLPLRAGHARHIFACPCCGRRIRGISYFRHAIRCRQYDLEQLIARAKAGPWAEAAAYRPQPVAEPKRGPARASR